MPAQSKGQKKTVGRVMHEFKRGELDSGSGRKVRNPKQAIAIALSEAGASRSRSGAQNAQSRRRAKANERGGQTGKARKTASRTKSSAGESTARGSTRTRQELYDAARRRGVPGRSRMNKAELERALKR
ncbi:MAG: hypothetical protein JWN93_1394 [Hyphomicrobiales bacterium]|nr:hypothetical protein [Hyphomicrobiales bacterium]